MCYFSGGGVVCVCVSMCVDSFMVDLRVIRCDRVLPSSILYRLVKRRTIIFRQFKRFRLSPIGEMHTHMYEWETWLLFSQFMRKWRAMRNYLPDRLILCLRWFIAIDSSVNHFDHTVIFIGRRSYCILCSYIKRRVFAFYGSAIYVIPMRCSSHMADWVWISLRKLMRSL